MEINAEGNKHANGHGNGSHQERVIDTEILIVGSGPTGATYARKLVDAGLQVLMVEIGSQDSVIPGDHQKNNFIAQKDINNFIHIVKGGLATLSVPSDKQTPSNLDPSSWSIDPCKGTIQNGQNPHQQAFDNLEAAAATRMVGGMGSHWTCCTPRQHPKLERSPLFTDQEWATLYDEAEDRIKTNSGIFEDSIRQQLVKRTLQKFDYGHGNRKFLSMPLAVQKIPNQSFLQWSCSAVLFGDVAKKLDNSGKALFTLKSQSQCIKLARNSIGGIDGARCRDLKTEKEFLVRAKKYILCAGSILTPGILYNSGWTEETKELPALGRYLTEQTMAFSQIVLSRQLVDSVKTDPFHLDWDKWVAAHHKIYPHDPLPFPFTDPDPQVYTPVAENYPWHTQIHRDAFSYGEVPKNIDQRLIVDLRWFGWVTPVPENRVCFTTKFTDQFGMPQPTFNFQVPAQDVERTHEMMADMCLVASKLGGYLPGAEPKFLVPGSALHISGTTRAGTDPLTSVCNKFGKVWGVHDLYVGGCGVIPTGAACNPTLTAMCFAIAGADAIVRELKGMKAEDSKC